MSTRFSLTIALSCVLGLIWLGYELSRLDGARGQFASQSRSVSSETPPAEAQKQLVLEMASYLAKDGTQLMPALAERDLAEWRSASQARGWSDYINEIEKIGIQAAEGPAELALQRLLVHGRRGSSTDEKQVAEVHKSVEWLRAHPDEAVDRLLVMGEKVLSGPPRGESPESNGSNDLTYESAEIVRWTSEISENCDCMPLRQRVQDTLVRWARSGRDPGLLLSYVIRLEEPGSRRGLAMELMSDFPEQSETLQSLHDSIDQTPPPSE